MMTIENNDLGGICDDAVQIGIVIATNVTEFIIDMGLDIEAGITPDNVMRENMDGYVSWRELPKEMKKRLVQGFKAVDKDGDGKLNMDEMHKLTLQQSQARAERRANQEQNAADAR